MPISQVTENSIDPHANLRYPLVGTVEYIQADINLTFLKLVDAAWVEQNEDKIMLALLTDKQFLSTVSKYRNNQLDKKVAMTTEEFAGLEKAINDKPQVDPIVSEATAPSFIMAANINPVVLNYADNIKQIKNQIDEACKKGVKLLVFPDSSLTGHDLDDAVRYVRNKEIQLLLADIAAYAQQRNPGLTVAIGHPYSPKNDTEQDRSQRFVSAMSILENGEIKKVILRSEEQKMPTHNTPTYSARQNRTLNNYQDGIVSTDNHYLVEYNGKMVNVVFCFDAPKKSISGDVIVQVGGTQGKDVANSIYINQRGVPAASTVADGRIAYTPSVGYSLDAADKFSLADTHSATFDLDTYKNLSLTSPSVESENDEQALMLAHDAMFAYSYIRSAPLTYTVTLNGDLIQFTI